jgi:hypothetical protein
MLSKHQTLPFVRATPHEVKLLLGPNNVASAMRGFSTVTNVTSASAAALRVERPREALLSF